MRQSSRIFAVLAALLALVPALVFGTGSDETAGPADDEIVVVEVWDANSQNGRLDIDHPMSVFSAERFGIAFEGPVVSWNGGTDYLQQLRIRIAAADMPDIFLPWGGIEAELIENDAIRPLTALIEENMPVYHAAVPPEVWDFVASQSDDGEIYFLPSVNFTPLGAHIRGDWLDRLGMEVPTTIDEYVEVLRAFRDEDANGNGDPNDEIPTSAREFARWMDHNFAPFGVAMVEGFPAWDIYDGEIQYSAVQPEMKAALEWIRGLYAEGLLDPESFINTNQIWRGKIRSDRVGVWYHGLHWSLGNFRPLYDSGIEEVNFTFMPVLDAPGFEGFYTKSEFRRPERVFVESLSDEVVARAMQFYEWLNDPGFSNERRFDGIEGFHWEMVDGAPALINGTDWVAASDGYRAGVGEGLHSNAAVVIDNMSFGLGLAEASDNTREIIGRQGVIRLVEEYTQDNTRSIAGQFLPSTIYDGYPDLQAHKMYQEYAARIIVGEWELDRFDEFVDRWYAEGGTEVTERAQALYAALQ